MTTRVEATQQQTGELVERATFQAYGAAESDYRPERWGSFREDYRFTGKEEDVEIGLQYFGKRYLNPLLGRWVSADPLTVHGAGADPNAYAYVSGAVLKDVDPHGLKPKAKIPPPGATVRTFDHRGSRDHKMRGGRQQPARAPKPKQTAPKAPTTTPPSGPLTGPGGSGAEQKGNETGDAPSTSTPPPDHPSDGEDKGKGGDGQAPATALDKAVALAGLWNGGEPGEGGVRNGLPGGQGTHAFGDFGRSLYVALTVVDIVGAVASVKGLVQGALKWAGKAIVSGATKLVQHGRVGLLKAFKKLCSFPGDTEVVMADGRLVPIRSVRVGDRVQSAAPCEEPPADTAWRFVEVTAFDTAGRRAKLTSLYPAAEVRAAGTREGDVALIEDETSGTLLVGKVTYVSGSFTLPAGPGCLVTSTSEHSSDEVLSLDVSGETLRVTRNHPLYSQDRQQWVDAGEVAAGEVVQRLLGGGGVATKLYDGTGARETVYNLEVYGSHEYAVGTAGVRVHNCNETKAAKAVADFATAGTRNYSALYRSEREARSLARTKLGRNPVQVEPGKLRSADGRWQYRGKPEDLAGHRPGDSPHIHLERLNPKTGEVLENWHLRWNQ